MPSKRYNNGFVLKDVSGNSTGSLRFVKTWRGELEVRWAENRWEGKLIVYKSASIL
ncbi:MAG: hypothetical protein V1860_00265 [bacterium]